jgi:hypothetical protein
MALDERYDVHVFGEHGPRVSLLDAGLHQIGNGSDAHVRKS